MLMSASARYDWNQVVNIYLELLQHGRLQMQSRSIASVVLINYNQLLMLLVVRFLLPQDRSQTPKPRLFATMIMSP